jgi:hypothetical protein
MTARIAAALVLVSFVVLVSSIALPSLRPSREWYVERVVVGAVCCLASFSLILAVFVLWP